MRGCLLRDLSQMQLLCLITFKKIRIWLTDVHLRFYLLRDIMVADFELDPEKPQREWEIPTYFQSLHTSDKYLGEFIDGVKQLDKKVVVLFYGDHSAGLPAWQKA